MKMEPFSVSQSALPQLHVRLTRSQRTLIAEAQRILLHYSEDIIAHCAAVAGTAGAKVADEVCNMLLWRRMPPETWPLPRLLHLLSQTSPAPGTAERAALPREAFDNIVQDIERLKAL
ncbi:hypothetical protein [Amaricoccus tamworthensis]|uniref:hypothetical protein n=1 Tax=Amaricoccus tamworthensis TaxID=57002 RepID=UPI003C7CCA7D